MRQVYFAMRKDFDTGQISQIINYQPLHTLSHRIVSFLLCLTLLGTLFMQPNTIAAAEDSTIEDELNATATFPLSDISTEIQNEVEQSTADESYAESPDTNSAANNVAVDTDDSLAVETTQSSSTTVNSSLANNVDTTALVSSSTDISSTTPVDFTITGATSSSTVLEAGTTSTSSPQSTSTGDVAETEAPTTQSDETETKIADTSSASTTTATTSGSVMYATVSDDSMMQFDRTRCTPVAGGAYYCQNADVSDVARSNLKNGFHALPDKDGDLEIFLVQDGEFTQITFNTVDDAAPTYDASTNSVVWHRAVDDRYQIMAYDFKTETETQLTNDAVNNMQPVKSGDFIAWQKWVKNNWQIMLYDGSNTTQLTYSDQHNIAPAIRGNYLLWKQQRSNEEQTVEVYDLQTKQQYSISDPDGGVISNPRMMLLYESEFDNGDVVTRGLDLVTNEIVPIQSTPVPLPENIPSPEPLDEVRALVTKTINEDEEGTSDDTEPTNDSDDPTTYQPGDVVMTATASSTDTSAATTTTITMPVATISSSTEAGLELDLRADNEEDLISEFDVFVPPFTASTSDDASVSTVLEVESSEVSEQSSSTTSMSE